MQKSALLDNISQYQKHIRKVPPAVAGSLTRVVGLTLEAKGVKAPVGSQCQIETLNGFIDAEVVGFNGDILPGPW